MYALQVAFPAFRQVDQTSNASLVDYFQVTTAPSSDDCHPTTLSMLNVCGTVTAVQAEHHACTP